MLHEPELLIDRQFKYLLSREGAEFFLEARRCLRGLKGEPRVAALLDELRQEAAALDRYPRDQDDGEVAQLLELKGKFLAQAPNADDSSAEEPASSLPTAWVNTLAAFDAFAERRRKPSAEGDGTRSAHLLHILGEKISALRAPPGAKADQRPDLAGLALEVANLEEEHDFWVQASKADLATSPGIALLGLEGVLAVLNPPPVASSINRDRVERMAQDLFTGKQAFRSAVYGDGKTESLSKPLTECKAFAERLYEGLRLKVGSSRSALALLRRFKTRCQVHDRKRLQRIAARADERALTAELALWLFDQGLNPITEVPIAGVRPDILDASRNPGSSLYVEAKQYKKGDAIRHRIQRAMYQVYTSVGRLRGDHLDVTEAFLVIFRPSGALVHLPEEMPAGDYVIFPIVIDIAQRTGSRETARPITMSLEELRPEVVETTNPRR